MYKTDNNLLIENKGDFPFYMYDFVMSIPSGNGTGRLSQQDDTGSLLSSGTSEKISNITNEQDLRRISRLITRSREQNLNYDYLGRDNTNYYYGQFGGSVVIKPNDSYIILEGLTDLLDTGTDESQIKFYPNPGSGQPMDWTQTQPVIIDE